MHYVLSVLRTIPCYALKFPSIQNSARKKAFPFTQHISKFLFSISERWRELFDNQLLGQFRQTYVKVCIGT